MERDDHFDKMVSIGFPEEDTIVLRLAELEVTSLARMGENRQREPRSKS